jgi:hypothetical protein
MPWKPISGIDGFVLRVQIVSAQLDEGHEVTKAVIEPFGIDVVEVVAVPDGGDGVACH